MSQALSYTRTKGRSEAGVVVTTKRAYQQKFGRYRPKKGKYDWNLAKLHRRVNIIQKSLQAETNFFDTQQTGTSITNNLAVALLTSIPQGVVVGSRRGDSIQVTALEVNFDILGADTTNALRVIILVDTNDTGGSNLGAAAVLQDTTNYLSPYLSSSRGRFVILYDKIFYTSSGGPDRVGDGYSKVFKKPWELTYNGDNVGARKNNMYMCLISDSSAASHPAINFYTRVRYMDS